MFAEITKTKVNLLKNPRITVLIFKIFISLQQLFIKQTMKSFSFNICNVVLVEVAKRRLVARKKAVFIILHFLQVSDFKTFKNLLGKVKRKTDISII